MFEVIRGGNTGSPQKSQAPLVLLPQKTWEELTDDELYELLRNQYSVRLDIPNY